LASQKSSQPVENSDDASATRLSFTSLKSSMLCFSGDGLARFSLEKFH